MYKKAFSLLLSLTALSVANAAPDILDNAKAILEVSHDGVEHAKAVVKEGKEKAFLRVDQKRTARKEASEEPEKAPVDDKQIFPLKDHDKADLEEIMEKVRVHQAKNALKETMETTAARVEDAMTYLKEAASGRVDELKALVGEIMQEHQAAVDAQQVFPVTDIAGNPCLCTCKGGMLIDVFAYEALAPTKTLCFSAVFSQAVLIDRPAIFKCTPYPECPTKNQWKIPTEDEPYEPATADIMPADETLAVAARQDETTAADADPQQRK